MNITDGKLLPRSISKVLPNKLSGDLVELFLLLIIGAVAIFIHSRLRIPTQMPGKYGMIYLALIMTAHLSSKFKFSGTIASLGAISLLLLNVLGFHDPFMPVIYLFVGFVIDVLFIGFQKFTDKAWFVVLVGGLAWMTIPIIRMILFLSIGFIHGAPKYAPIVPFISHFVFGCVGALVAFSALKIAGKSSRKHVSK